MTNLRHHTVLVDEGTPGRFCWIICESSEDGAWMDVKSSAGYFATRREAFEAGWTALRALAQRHPAGRLYGKPPPSADRRSPGESFSEQPRR